MGGTTHVIFFVVKIGKIILTGKRLFPTYSEGANSGAMEIAMKNGSNRHVVDQLAIVRAEIKELKAREDGLKDAVSLEMGSADSLGGDDFIARQTLSERKGGIDEKAAKAAGVNLDDYRKAASVVMTLRVEPRVHEAAQ